MYGGYGTLTPADVKREVQALRDFGEKLRRTPGAAKAFLIKHGYITKSGKLTKRYRPS